MKKKILLLLTLTIITNACILGQDLARTWNGSINNDWQTAGNWTPAAVPTPINNVTIPGSVASGNWPVLSGTGVMNSIFMGSGSQLDVNGFALQTDNKYLGANGFYGATLNNSKSTGINIRIGFSGIPTIYTSFNNNIVNDDLVFTVFGIYPSNQFTEGGNQYNGKVTFNIYGGVSLFVSNTIPSLFNADLTINHNDGNPPDIPGPNMLFNAGATIKGNFTLSSNDPGGTYLGNITNKTTIGGTVNIIIPAPIIIGSPIVTPYVFSMLWLVNQTTGGSIDVQNSLGFNVQNDTLLLTSMRFTGYGGSANGYLSNNNITGDITISDDTGYTGGWGTFVRNNTITGNCSFSNNGTNNFYDGDSMGTGNKYIGNVTYIQKGGSTKVGAGDFDEISQNLTLSSEAGITLGNLKFNGGTNGIVEQLGSQPISISVIAMEKTGTGTITLNDSVTITGTATFTSGNIISSTLNNLIFSDGATQTGASEASFVDGPVTKIGNEGFTFPSGIDTVFAPISITAPALATDAFTAQYFNTNPSDAGYDSTQHDLSLNHVSQKEYWLLERINGTATPKLTLSWNAKRSGAVDVIADLRVAHWNGSGWKDEGNGGTTGTNDEGTVQSLNNISDFSPFTLASSSFNNPLNLNFISFKATLLADISVLLQWETAEEISIARFEVERSTDGINWIKIAALIPLASLQYEYTDIPVIDGTYYYRIKQVDIDGNYRYSIIQIIKLNREAKLLVWPNPTSDILFIQTKFTNGNLQITDVNGKIILERAINSTVMAISVDQMAKGLYVLRILQNGDTLTEKFIKH